MTSFLRLPPFAFLALVSFLTACRSDPSSANMAPACNTGDFAWPDEAEPLWNNIAVTQVNRERPRATFVPLTATALPDQFVPYARPQESGNKVEVRFAALTDASGRGLLAVGAPLLSVNASPFSAESLEKAKHPFEVVPDGRVHLNLDLVQRGVAGDNSWGRPPLSEYIIEAEPRSYQYWIKALRPGEDPVELARRSLP